MGIQVTKNGVYGPGTMGITGLLCFTLFWCGITGVFVGFAGVTAYRVVDAKQRFLPADGVVTASRIVTQRGSKGGTSYTPVVEYDYTVNGKTFHSDRYEFMGGSSGDFGGSKRVVTEMVAKHPAMAKVTVYYDPKCPDSAVISRDLPEALLFIMLFLQPFMLIGLGMMIATVLAVYGLFRGRAFRNGNARRPPWPVPGWGVLRQEPGGAFVLRGGGRLSAAVLAFAGGYGLTCFLSIFVVAFGFLLALQGRYGIAIPVMTAFAVAVVVGAGIAQHTWRKGDPKVTFLFHPSRGKITVTGGEYKEPVSLRLDEIASLLLRNEWRTRKTKHGNTQYEVFVPKLVTADERELALCELDSREDADHLLTGFSELLGKPVKVAVGDESAAPFPGASRPKSVGEIITLVRNQWKKRRGK